MGFLYQSSRNAGVIHSGIYYSKEEEPLKVKYCVEGNKLLYEFCEREKVPYKKTGKLIVATAEAEREYLDYFYKSALNNKVPGVKKISADEIKKLEPNISAIYALYLPTSGLVDVDKLILKFKELAEKNGVKFITNTDVTDIKISEAGFVIKASSNKRTQSYTSDLVINAAGLYSDIISKMINKKSTYELLPTRGEFAEFKNTSNLKVHRNIYPTPFGFYKATGERAQVGLKEFLKLYKAGIVTRTVGVHLTPILTAKSTLGKVAIVGPAKTVNIGRIDYTIKLKPPEVYLKKISAFLTNIKREDLRLHYSGIMASEKNHKDFVIQSDENFSSFINLVGIDSPGMTACLSIAKHVEKLVNVLNAS